MNQSRSTKNIEKQILLSIKGMQCPVHSKLPTLKLVSENEEVQVEACCPFFKKDILIIGERIRKDFLYRAEKTKERIEREKKENASKH